MDVDTSVKRFVGLVKSHVIDFQIWLREFASSTPYSPPSPNGSRSGSGSSSSGLRPATRRLILAVVLVCMLVTAYTLTSAVLSAFTAQPPVLEACSAKRGGHSRAKLPTLIFLAGVEGGGHDLFNRFFRYLPVNVSVEAFNPSVLLTNEARQAVRTGAGPMENLDGCPKLPYARETYDMGVQMTGALMQKSSESPLTYVRSKDPFPMGRIRTPLARPDLVSLAHFHEVAYKLKVIVMVRNFTNAVRWSISRGFHSDDVGLQVRLIEDNLVYLDASVRSLACSSFAIVDVESLGRKADVAAPALASFLAFPGISSDKVASAMKLSHAEWEAAQSLDEEPPMFNNHAISKFFEARAHLWPLLDASIGVPISIPTGSHSWPR